MSEQVLKDKNGTPVKIGDVIFRQNDSGEKDFGIIADIEHDAVHPNEAKVPVMMGDFGGNAYYCSTLENADFTVFRNADFRALPKEERDKYEQILTTLRTRFRYMKRTPEQQARYAAQEQPEPASQPSQEPAPSQSEPSATVVIERGPKTFGKESADEPVTVVTKGKVEEWLSGLAKSYLDARVTGKLQNALPNMHIFQITVDGLNDTEAESAAHDILNGLLPEKGEMTDEAYVQLKKHFEAHTYIYTENSKATLRIAVPEIDEETHKQFDNAGLKLDEDSSFTYHKFTLQHALQHPSIGLNLNRLGSKPEEVDTVLTALANIVRHVDYKNNRVEMQVHTSDDSKDDTITVAKEKLTSSSSAAATLETLVAMAKATGWKDYKITAQGDDLINTAEAFMKAGLKLDKPTQEAYTKAKGAAPAKPKGAAPDNSPSS